MLLVNSIPLVHLYTDRGYELAIISIYSLATTFKLKQFTADSPQSNFTIGQKVWSLYQHFSQFYSKATEISVVSAGDFI